MAFPVLQEANHTLEVTLMIAGFALFIVVGALSAYFDRRFAKPRAKLAANIGFVAITVLALAGVAAGPILSLTDTNHRNDAYADEITSYMKHEYGIEVSSNWSAFKLASGLSVDVTDIEGKPLTVRFTERDSKNPKLWESGYKEVERLRN